MQSRAEARNLALQGNSHADRAGNGRGRGRGAYDGAPTPQHFHSVPTGPRFQSTRPTHDNFRPPSRMSYDLVDLANEDREQRNEGGVKVKEEPMADGRRVEDLSVPGVIAFSQQERQQATAMLAPPSPPAARNAWTPANLTDRTEGLENNLAEISDRISTAEGHIHELHTRAEQQQRRIQQLEKDNRALRQRVKDLQNSNTNSNSPQRMAEQMNAMDRRLRDMEQYVYPSNHRH